jgi:hypothetical protein
MLTPVESEIVLLRAVWEQVDEAVNRSMLTIHGQSPECEVLFHTELHQRYFNIVLVDLLAETDPTAPITKTDFLEGLASIADKPHLASAEAATSLRYAVQEFRQWLKQEVHVEAWLNSIGITAVLQLPRRQFIRMTGNLSKHGFLRTYRVASQLQQLLARSGVQVSVEQASLGLPEFYDRFHTDILNYHASTIAEFLNNIRWGIYDYLRPVFDSSFSWGPDGPPMYQYTYPAGVEHAYAKQVFWDMMNDVRSPPYIERFAVHRWVKQRY